METNQVVRIFISSPGDVAVERNKARKVVEALQKRYAGRLRLETVLWEDLPLGADMSFQQGIDLVLSDEHGVDIAVFILWSRLGSRLGASFRKADGSEYRSGTEREFDLMLTARQQSPDNRPELLAYIRTDDQHFKEELMARQPDEIEEMIRQRKLAEQFIQEQFHDPQSGTNVRAYHTFPEPVSFALRLKTHLQSLLDQIAMEEGWCAGSWEGTPYRGLEVFEAEHAPIFFGRDEEVCEVLERLQAQADQGCPFVLIVGASGSGKSSLARAGVLPALETGGYDETVGVWRTAIAVPGQYGPRLCRGLAGTMLESIPELRVDDDSLSELEEVLAAGSGKALNMLLKRAFADAGKGGAVRFVLLLDQFEELFTATGTTDEEIRRFLRAVQALAFSGQVWIMATVRSDFYDRCQRFPLLMELKGDRGQMDLLPPEPSDVHRIITGPAMMAGLAFETSETGETLDQRILNDVVGHPEALPLLEFTLSNLFDHRSGEGVLTFTQYKTLGGVEGAIGHHAEKVFMALSDEVRAEFGAVFNALVTLDTSDDSQPVRRRVAVETVDDAATKKQLVDALVKARLLVSDRGELFVAHEALLRRWQRAIDWIDANREFLRIRQQVTQRRKQGGILVPEDPLYDAARSQMMQCRTRFDEADAAFIDAAVAESEVMELRRKRLRTTVLTALSLLTLCAFAAAGWAFKERGKANTNAEEAARQERIAQEKAAEAQANADDLQIANDAKMEQLHLASMADYSVAVRSIEQDEKWHEGVAHLARALKFNPRNELAAARLYSTLAYHELEMRNWPQLILEGVGSDAPAQFSPDGTRIVTVIGSVAAQLWDVVTGERVGDSMMHEDIEIARFSHDGTRILTSGGNTNYLWDAVTGESLQLDKGDISEWADLARNITVSPDGTRYLASDGNTVRVRDMSTGEPVGKPIRHDSNILTTQFSPEGTRILTTSSDSYACVWDAATGKAIGVPLRHQSQVTHAEFSSNETRILTRADNRVFVWDTAPRKSVVEPLFHVDGLLSAVFSPDGSLITESDDSTIRVWDVTTGKPFGEPLQHENRRQGATLGSHDRGYFFVDYLLSSDGAFIATANEYGNVCVWDVATGKPIGKPFHPEGECLNMQFSPDGTRIVTVIDSVGAQLWDVVTGERVGDSMEHAEIKIARFIHDGTRILTSGGNTNYLWDAATGIPVVEVISDNRGFNRAAQFSPDGSRFITVDWDKFTIDVWDAYTGKAIGELIRSKEPSEIRSGRDSSGVKFGRLREPSWAFAGGERYSVGVQFSTDGSRILAFKGHECGVWDVTTREQIGGMMRHDSIGYANFSSDGTRIITKNRNFSLGPESIRIWDAATGLPVGEMMWHENFIRSYDFSPDGTIIVTASTDHTARLWDAATGKPIGEPMRHEGAVLNAQFSSDGTRIVTAGGDNVRVWLRKDLGDPVTALVPVPPEILKYAYAVAGMRFNDDSLIQEISYEDRIAVLKNPPQGLGAWTDLANWIVAPVAARPATPNSKMDIRDADQLSTIINGYYANSDQVEAVTFLLTKGADIEAAEWDGSRPLMLAARRGYTEICRLLLNAGADVNARDKGGRTALMEAVRHGHMECTRLLLSHGADPLIMDQNGYTAMIWSILEDSSSSELLADLFGVDTFSVEAVKGSVANDDTHRTQLIGEAIVCAIELAVKEEDWVSYRRNLEEMRKAIPENDPKLSGYQSRILERHDSLRDWLGMRVWTQELAGDFSSALRNALKLKSINPDNRACYQQVNLAHAYLLNDQFDEAKAIYTRYLGWDFAEKKQLWDDVVRQGFGNLRKAGVDHPDMKKIEALLADYKNPRELRMIEIRSLPKWAEAADRYKLIKGKYTWHEAKADAETRGGHLSTVTSSEEWEIILTLFDTDFRQMIAWLGATDEKEEGVWKWVTGEPLTFNAWNPGEPNNAYDGAEDYLHIYGYDDRVPTKGWNDCVEDHTAGGYVLEIE